MTDEFDKIEECADAASKHWWKPPCRWLRWIWVPFIGALAGGYKGYEGVQGDLRRQAEQSTAIVERVKVLEKGLDRQAEASSRMADEVAALRGENRAVLRTAERILDEVSALRKERK